MFSYKLLVAIMFGTACILGQILSHDLLRYWFDNSSVNLKSKLITGSFIDLNHTLSLVKMHSDVFH